MLRGLLGPVRKVELMSSAKGPELWDLGNEVESRASQALPHTNSEGSVKGQPLALWVYGRVFVV